MNGHFLRPTTSAKSISWVSTIVLGEKNLAPSKVGQTENFQTCLMDYQEFIVVTGRKQRAAEDDLGCSPLKNVPGGLPV